MQTFFSQSRFRSLRKVELRRQAVHHNTGQPPRGKGLVEADGELGCSWRYASRYKVDGGSFYSVQHSWPRSVVCFWFSFALPSKVLDLALLAGGPALELLGNPVDRAVQLADLVVQHLARHLQTTQTPFKAHTHTHGGRREKRGGWEPVSKKGRGSPQVARRSGSGDGGGLGSSQAPRFYLQVLTPVPQELLHPLAVEQGPGDLRGEEKAQNAEDGSADEDPGPEPARSVPPASRGGDETGPPGRRHPPERKTLLCISGRPRSRRDDLAPTARRRPGARDAPRCRVRHLVNLSLPVVSVSSPSVAALAARTLACCASGSACLSVLCEKKKRRFPENLTRSDKLSQTSKYRFFPSDGN